MSNMTQFNNKVHAYSSRSFSPSFKNQHFLFLKRKGNENNLSSGFPKLIHYLETNDSLSD